MKLEVDPHSSIPVYKQLIAAIVASIEADELAAGDKLPSIRELSVQLRINPNTTAKAYRELELRGFVESRVGSGCFVRHQSAEAAAAEKKVRMQQLFDKVVGEAKAHHIHEREFLHFLKLKGSS